MFEIQYKFKRWNVSHKRIIIANIWPSGAFFPANTSQLLFTKTHKFILIRKIDPKRARNIITHKSQWILTFRVKYDINIEIHSAGICCGTSSTGRNETEMDSEAEIFERIINELHHVITFGEKASPCIGLEIHRNGMRACVTGQLINSQVFSWDSR